MAWPEFGLLLIFPVLALVAPKMTVVAFVVAALAAMALNRQRLTQIDYGSTVPLVLLVLWAATSLLWTPDVQDAGAKYLRFLFIFVLVFLALPVLVLAKATGWMLAGIAIALGLLAFESVTDYALTRVLHGASGGAVLAPGPEYVGSRLNRGITTIGFVVWGALLVLRRRWLLVVVPPALTAFFMLFESLSGVLGLGAGSVAAVAALIHRRLGRLAVGIAIAIALFGVPSMVLSGLINSAKPPVATHDTAETLTVTPTRSSIRTSISNIAWTADRERVKIWHFLTDRFVASPVVGMGFLSTRAMSDSPHNGHMVSMSHPHNVGLELALELGAVGLLLIAIFLCILERRIAALGDACRIAATGLFVTALAVSTTAYGVWQAHAFLSMVFGYMAWQSGRLAYREADAPPVSAVRS